MVVGPVDETGGASTRIEVRDVATRMWKRLESVCLKATVGFATQVLMFLVLCDQ